MDKSRAATVLTGVAFAVFVALRLPWALGWEPTGEEPLCIGMSRHVLLERDWRAAPLLRHPPLASHVGGVLLWPLQTPVEPWDTAAPATQVGWTTLAESRLRPDDAPLAPRTVAILARLPVLLLGLLGMVLVRRVGDRIHGPLCGGVAALAWALHPGLAVHGALAATEGVAAAAAATLLTATADVATNPITEGAEVRRRQYALGMAGGLAALASHALWPLLLVCVCWLATRAAARRRRADPDVRRERGGWRRVALAGLVVAWAGYAFELRPAVGPDGAHPLTDALAAVAGLEHGTLGSLAGRTWLPAASWFRSLGHTLLVEERAAPLATLAALGTALPWGLLALLVAGLLGFVHLLRDRADLPSLLFYATFTPLAGALVLPPRLTVACALVAAPGAILLGAAAVGRLAARKRIAALVGAGAVLALFGLQWTVGGPPRELARLSSGEAGAAALSAEEDWQIQRLSAAGATHELHVVAGPPRGLTARGENLIRRHELGDDALESVLGRLAEPSNGHEPEGQPGGMLVVGSWLVEAIPALRGAEPARRIGRLLVFRIR